MDCNQKNPKYQAVDVIESCSKSLSRVALIKWINSLSKRKYEAVEQLHNGLEYCLLINRLFPHTIPKDYIRFKIRHSHDSRMNWKEIQIALRKLKVSKIVPIDDILNARLLDNLRFLQWFKRFYDVNAQALQRMCPMEKNEPAQYSRPAQMYQKPKIYTLAQVKEKNGHLDAISNGCNFTGPGRRLGENGHSNNLSNQCEKRKSQASIKPHISNTELVRPVGITFPDYNPNLEAEGFLQNISCGDVEENSANRSKTYVIQKPMFSEIVHKMKTLHLQNDGLPYGAADDFRTFSQQHIGADLNASLNENSFSLENSFEYGEFPQNARNIAIAQNDEPEKTNDKDRPNSTRDPQRLEQIVDNYRQTVTHVVHLCRNNQAENNPARKLAEKIEALVMKKRTCKENDGK